MITVAEFFGNIICKCEEIIRNVYLAVGDYLKDLRHKLKEKFTKHDDAYDFLLGIHRESYYVQNLNGYFSFNLNEEDEYDAWDDGFDDFFPIEIRAYLKEPYDGSFSEFCGKKFIHIYGFYCEEDFLAFIEELGLNVCYTCGRIYSYTGTVDMSTGRTYCGTCSAKHLDKKYASWNVLTCKDLAINHRIYGISKKENLISLDERKITHI